MATEKTEAQILAQLADNVVGNISAENVQDLAVQTAIASLHFNGASVPMAIQEVYAKVVAYQSEGGFDHTAVVADLANNQINVLIDCDCLVSFSITAQGINPRMVEYALALNGVISPVATAKERFTDTSVEQNTSMTIPVRVTAGSVIELMAKSDLLTSIQIHAVSLSAVRIR